MKIKVFKALSEPERHVGASFIQENNRFPQQQRARKQYSPSWQSGTTTTTKNKNAHTPVFSNNFFFFLNAHCCCLQVKCYHRRSRAAEREVVFRVQFHTCTVHGAQLWFGKTELDLACSGMKTQRSVVSRGNVQNSKQEPFTGFGQPWRHLVESGAKGMHATRINIATYNIAVETCSWMFLLLGSLSMAE